MKQNINTRIHECYGSDSELALLVRAYRKSFRLTIRGFGILAGVSHLSVWRLENRKRIRLDTIEKIRRQTWKDPTKTN